MKNFYVYYVCYESNGTIFREDDYGPFETYEEAYAWMTSEICEMLHKEFHVPGIPTKEITVTKFNHYNEKTEITIKCKDEEFPFIWKIKEEKL